MKNIAILGSTGSIGTQTLEIVDEFPQEFNVVAISCNQDIKKFETQIAKYNPAYAVVTDEKAYGAAKHIKNLYPNTQLLCGQESLIQIVSLEEIDTVLMAIVGNDALLPTIQGIKSKKRICIANKEVLVTSGHLIMPLVAKYDVTLIPVDSEHSALFQALQGNRYSEIEKVILTASGGPFRGRKRDDLAFVTAADSLKHPKWNMGKKISIDSATLMNKGLEVIEARWLFDLKPDQIDVVIHPESIIHSLVQYQDSSVIAQMGLPDMRLPIIYALNYPQRHQTALKRMDLTELMTLTFEKPDRETFPCLDLAYHVLQLGGIFPTILNAANEVLVERYLEDEIDFYDIPRGIEWAVGQYSSLEAPTLEDVLMYDQDVRALMEKWKNQCGTE